MTDEKDKEKDPKLDEKKDALVPAQFGDPQIFVKLTPDGRLLALKAKVVLREELGHMYEVHGKMSITSNGYHFLNQFAGISLVSPHQIMLPDGVAVPNPYPVPDEKTGYTRAVWVRRIAYGLSPMANLVLVDRSLFFDLKAYLLEDMVKKVNKFDGLGKFMKQEDVAAHEVQTQKKGWFLPVEAEIGIWVDLSHKEVLQAIETHTQRMRFAERIATSICERNCLRAHPAIARSQVLTQGSKGARYAETIVFGFRHDLDRKQMTQLATSVAEGDEERYKAEARTLGMTVETHEGVDHARPEDLVEAEVVEPNGEDVTVREPAHVQEEPAADRQEALELVRQGRQALSDEPAFFKMMKNAGITTTLAEAPLGQLKDLAKGLSSEVDRRVK